MAEPSTTPGACLPGAGQPMAGRYTTTHVISALPLDGSGRCGPITQLPQGADVEVYGPGLNANTVAVHHNGSAYIVFSADLIEPLITKRQARSSS